MIEIINNYIPNKICKKLINIICKKVNKSKLYKNYNFSYHTQKYKLKNKKIKKLQYRDRIDIMLKNFTEKQKQIYKKRIQV